MRANRDSRRASGRETCSRRPRRFGWIPEYPSRILGRAVLAPSGGSRFARCLGEPVTLTCIRSLRPAPNSCNGGAGLLLFKCGALLPFPYRPPVAVRPFAPTDRAHPDGRGLNGRVSQQAKDLRELGGRCGPAQRGAAPPPPARGVVVQHSRGPPVASNEPSCPQEHLKKRTEHPLHQPKTGENWTDVEGVGKSVPAEP